MIAVIVTTGYVPETIAALMLLVAGCALGVVSLAYIRLDNVRIFPEPKKNIRLVTTGPYKVVRHPMYVSVLLLSASFVIESPSFVPILAWFILLYVLLEKIRIEETLLSQRLPEYDEYKKRTWKLIPFLF